MAERPSIIKASVVGCGRAAELHGPKHYSDSDIAEKRNLSCYKVTQVLQTARLFELLMMKNSGAIRHDPRQKYNINVIMIWHLFSPGEVYTSPVSIMWLYGLHHIWKSKAADIHERRLLLSFHGGTGGGGGLGAELLACVNWCALWYLCR